jgi:radical SAM protein with 4Fe4S-binding SPASM domain
VTLTAQPQMTRLPLAILYLTERCNSRCVTCDYWRHGRADITLESVDRLIPSFKELGTEIVVLSGGEPLIHPEWASIAGLLRNQGIDLWLLTSGLSLAKHAVRAVSLFKMITVSLDGADASTYKAIRGVDAFDKVCEGIRLASSRGAAVSIRVTLQRSNYRQLPEFVALARQLKVREVSFLAVDVANPHAFGRTENFENDLALSAADLVLFEQILSQLERNEAAAFEQKLIAESPAKLHRIHQYFTAVQGLTPYPKVRCNAPEFSAVVDSFGQVHPCFFIAGPGESKLGSAVQSQDLKSLLNAEEMTSLRSSIRSGARRECTTCVCSLWREGGHVRTLADATVQ